MEVTFHPRHRILNPEEAFLQKWNKIFVLSCVISVSLDPLFFYIPVIDGKKKCLGLDKKLEIIACVLRSFIDIFYILHILFQFRTGFIAPTSRVFGRGELIEDLHAIAKRYLSSYLIIDVLSVLPLPQVVVFVIVPNKRGPESLNVKDLLKYVILSQYVPRLIRIYPLYIEVTRAFGMITKTAWGGAAFYLFLYMLISHVVGALWYMFTIERQERCWRSACDRYKLNYDNLYCGEHHAGVYSFLNTSCPLLEPNEIKDLTDFNFGIFLEALQSHVVETRDFSGKLFYCFWWGLRNLSSIGQNLRTSTFVWEILFAVFISILGLIFYSFLIGNVQKYLQSLQSIAVREEIMRAKGQAVEQWMNDRMLPGDMRGRIRMHEQYKWQETKGIEEESLLVNLPRDIRRDIKRHLCFSLLIRVPMFEKLDEQLLDTMCDRLKPVLYSKHSYIFREGDPVEEMLFVTHGKLLTVSTNGGSTGFFNSYYLKNGDFCGEELLEWALSPFSSKLPSSTRTVKTVTGLKAFVLMADDLKFVMSQWRHDYSKQLQSTFRFYSQRWRTWAACFIQAAWRQHCRRKLQKYLQEEDRQLQAALAKEGGVSTSLGTAIYASKFAINALKAVRCNHASNTELPQKLPPLLLLKPAE
uniref:Putative cyclic nucleotide-gated ion channel 1-like isoform X1 n=1 Tax=Davidia involucrata TaxID=16924 RepID=A0A5B7B186_DAVIN